MCKQRKQTRSAAILILVAVALWLYSTRTFKGAAHTSAPETPPRLEPSIVANIRRNAGHVPQSTETTAPHPGTTIAICTLTKSRPSWKSLADTTLQKLLIPSIEHTVLQDERSVYSIELHIGADHNDAFWIRHHNLLQHPPWLNLRFYFYTKTRRFRLPFNNLTDEAYANGADYLVRINDDTEFVTNGWVTKGVAALRGMRPPNVGVIGPHFSEGNTVILTHDMVHRTHIDIFGTYYPTVFDNWYVDDWITHVYGKDRTLKLAGWRVKHHTTAHGQRYVQSGHQHQHLENEVKTGSAKIDAWLSTKGRQAKRVVSYSLYGSDRRYTDGIVENANLMPTIYPGWEMRVYYAADVPEGIANSLRAYDHVELVPGTPFISPMVWRFLVASDPTVSRYIVRDADSRLSVRERAAVGEWVRSGQKFHVMRDHPSHSNYAMSGGLWGGTHPAFPDMKNLLSPVGRAYIADMNFLTERVWPVAKQSVLQHDAFGCRSKRWGETRPFPTERNGLEHVGSVFINGKMRQGDVDILRGALGNECAPKSTVLSSVVVNGVPQYGQKKTGGFSITSRESKRKLCNRIGCELRESSGLTVHTRSARWEKIAFINRLLMNTTIGRIVWMDADVVVSAAADHLPPQTADLLVTPDWGLAVQLDKAANARAAIKINTGVMFIKNTPWSREFFKAVWRDNDSGKGKSDQNSINKLIRMLPPAEFSTRVALVPRTKWNAFPRPDGIENVCNIPADTWKGDATPESSFVHFAGVFGGLCLDGGTNENAMRTRVDQARKLIVTSLPTDAQPDIDRKQSGAKIITQDILRRLILFVGGNVEPKTSKFRGLTMQSATELRTLALLVEKVVNDGVGGNVYETGCWRGGTSFFMAAIFELLESPRQYFLFDSFAGFPKSNDSELDNYLRVGNENGFYVANTDAVRASIDKLSTLIGVPDLQSRFHLVKGRFEDTIPVHKATDIAILRLDGDLYTSTKVVLENLYAHVTEKGWIIIDDYKWNPPRLASTKLAKSATDEFRDKFNILAPMVDKGKPSWQKGINAVLTIWSNDFHISPIATMKRLFPRARFIDKSLSGHCRMTNTCATDLKVLNKNNGISPLPATRRAFVEAYKDDPEFAKVDIVMCFHPSAMCELFMPLGKRLFVIATTRYEMGRHTRQQWFTWNENLKKIAATPGNVIGANNLYDARYIEYFTGLKPVVLPSFAPVQSAYRPHDKSVLVAEMHSPSANLLMGLLAAASPRIVALRKKYPKYTNEQLCSNTAILHLPYQLSVMSLFEQYGMGIPILVPTVNFLWELHDKYDIVTERTWERVRTGTRPTGSVVAGTNASGPDPNDDTNEHAFVHWAAYSDYYQWPHIVQFGSFAALGEIIETTDWKETSFNMRKYWATTMEKTRSTLEKLL